MSAWSDSFSRLQVTTGVDGFVAEKRGFGSERLPVAVGLVGSGLLLAVAPIALTQPGGVCTFLSVGALAFLALGIGVTYRTVRPASSDLSVRVELPRLWCTVDGRSASLLLKGAQLRVEPKVIEVMPATGAPLQIPTVGLASAEVEQLVDLLRHAMARESGSVDEVPRELQALEEARRV